MDGCEVPYLSEMFLHGHLLCLVLALQRGNFRWEPLRAILQLTFKALQDVQDSLAPSWLTDILIQQMAVNVTDMMDYYADVAKDPVKVQEVCDVLAERGLISSGGHYSPLINVRLNLVS